MSEKLEAVGGIGFEIDTNFDMEELELLADDNDFRVRAAGNLLKGITRRYIFSRKDLEDLDGCMDDEEILMREFLDNNDIEILSDFEIHYDTYIY